MTEKLNSHSLAHIEDLAEIYKSEEFTRDRKLSFRTQIRDHLLEKGYSRFVIQKVLKNWNIIK